MKVLAINGSPHKKGNTYFALEIMKKKLEQQGIETEIFHIGNQAIRGCDGCGTCGQTKNLKCIHNNDSVNEGIQKMSEADGIILGSPVHFAAMSGTMKSFLDRAFYVQGRNGKLFRHKIGCSLAVARRSGEVAAFDQLNHYLHFAEMLVPSGNYWASIHGRTPGEVLEDKEGVQILEVLADNMAWLMKVLEKSTIKPPKAIIKESTSFIR